MSLFKKLFKADDRNQVDYYREGLELLSVGKYHEALTSFRLALKETPRDTAVLQQMAITYTRIGMTDEAIKTYRNVLDVNSDVPGAHYGLAFLLLRDGRNPEALDHLKLFLAQPPQGPEARRHIEHARQTVAELQSDAGSGRSEPAPDAQ